MTEQNGRPNSDLYAGMEGYKMPPATNRDRVLPGGSILTESEPSTFAREFQGIAGRAPTAEETRRHLEYDRLAKSSALDPMTMAMIVAGSRDAETQADRKALTTAIESDRAALVASMARIERKVGIRPSVWSPTAAELRAATVGLLAGTLLSCVILQFIQHPTPVGLAFSFVASVGACAAFSWWRAR
jgi:hypothetical protein